MCIFFSSSSLHKNQISWLFIIRSNNEKSCYFAHKARCVIYCVSLCAPRNTKKRDTFFVFCRNQWGIWYENNNFRVLSIVKVAIFTFLKCAWCWRHRIKNQPQQISYHRHKKGYMLISFRATILHIPCYQIKYTHEVWELCYHSQFSNVSLGGLIH